MTLNDVYTTSGDEPKTVVLTGPSRGLGRATTLAIARRGHQLVLIGRPSGGFDAIRQDALDAGAAAVTMIEADLQSIESTRAAGNEIAALVARGDVPAIDVIIGSAGIRVGNGNTATVDGIEATFAVNVLANATLVDVLAPALAPHAHIVLVGSVLHRGAFPFTIVNPAPVWTSPEELARPDGGDKDVAGARAYSTSKLAVNYLVHALQREVPEGVRVNVYAPGLVVGTSIVRELSPFSQFFWTKVMPTIRFPLMTDEPTSTELLAAFALGESHVGARAAYVELDKVVEPSAISTDPHREADLLTTCRALNATAETSVTHA